MTHPTHEALGRWVAGLSTPEDSALLEAHVIACRECTAALQHEARVELALARASLAAPAAARRWWVVPAVLVPLTAAAALAIALLGHPARHLTPAANAAFFEVPRFEGDTPHEVLSSPAPL
jgi:hypothetical protein